MPEFSQHEIQADSNIAFVKFLDAASQFSDWMITGCFYAAVHIVEAAIFREPKVSYRKNDSSIEDSPNKDNVKIKHSTDLKTVIPTPTPMPHSPHAMRKNLIESNCFFSADYLDAYNNLEEMSKTSRYTCYEDCSRLRDWAFENLNIIIGISNKNERTSLPSV